MQPATGGGSINHSFKLKSNSKSKSNSNSNSKVQVHIEFDNDNLDFKKSDTNSPISPISSSSSSVEIEEISENCFNLNRHSNSDIMKTPDTNRIRKRIPSQIPIPIPIPNPKIENKNENSNFHLSELKEFSEIRNLCLKIVGPISGSGNPAKDTQWDTTFRQILKNKGNPNSTLNF